MLKPAPSLFLIAASIVLLDPGVRPGACLAQQSGAPSNQSRTSRDGVADDRTPELRETAEESNRLVVTKRRIREIEALEQQCLGEVNRLREAHGLVALELDEALLAVSREYSRRMAEEHFFAHADPDGRTVRDRVEEARIRWKMVGENLASSNGYINPVAATLRGWMDSKGHRANILEPGYRRTAIGVWISSNGTVYFTEIFLTQ